MAENDVNHIVAMFKSNDAAMIKLMKDITEVFDTLELEEINPKNVQFNLTRVLTIEYLVIKVRGLISHELVQIKSIMTLDALSIHSSLASEFKKRELYLVSVNTRLNELRDDANSIQKLAYSMQVRAL